MDDSLNDTQQEKEKMSVKRLHFEGRTWNLDVCIENDQVILDMMEEGFALDRNQAHMLMLYLQEHLGYVSISKDRLNET